MGTRRLPVPRNLGIYHINDQDQLQLTTSNNLTLPFVAPFLAIVGPILRHLHDNLRVRQEEVWVDNQDFIHLRQADGKR